jgi:MFS family permease
LTTGRFWLYSSFPNSFAVGPLSIFLALVILKQGTVVEYGLIVSGASFATVLASIIWGGLMDRGLKRSIFLVTSYAGTATFLSLMYLSHNVAVMASAYILLNFFQAASGPAANILIMQLWHREEWPSVFGFFTYLGSLGTVSALVASTLWTTYLPVKTLILLLVPFSAASAVMAFFSLKGVERIPLEREAMVMHRTPFINRFLATPTFFLRLPSKNDFKKFYKMLRNAFTRQTPLLYLCLFTFNLASGVFNTSFNPSLIRGRIPENLVFAVNIFAMTIQTIAMRRVGKNVSEEGERPTALKGLGYRIAGYSAMAASAYFLTSVYLAVASAFSYALAAGYAYSLFYVATTSMVFRSLPKGHQGGMLGVVSALSGIGVFLGSFISGFSALYAGYAITDIVAVAILAFTYTLLKGIQVAQ